MGKELNLLGGSADLTGSNLTLTKDDISTIITSLNQKRNWHKANHIGKVDDAVIGFIDSVKHRVKTSKRPV